METSIVLNSSELVPIQDRSCLLHSVQDVAAPSTLIDENVSDEVKILLVLIVSMMYNNPSPDVLALSSYAARRMAREMGIAEETVDLVIEKTVKTLEKIRQSNPLSGMF